MVTNMMKNLLFYVDYGTVQTMQNPTAKSGALQVKSIAVKSSKFKGIFTSTMRIACAVFLQKFLAILLYCRPNEWTWRDLVF